MKKSEEYIRFIELVDTSSHRHGQPVQWHRQVEHDRPQQHLSARGIFVAEVHLGAKHSVWSIRILEGRLANYPYSHHEQSLLSKEHCVVSTIAHLPQVDPRQ
jgi:hypothetical protein